MAQSQKRVDGGRIPGPAVIAGCVEVIVRFNAANQRFNNLILHGRNLGTFVPGISSANALLAAIGGNWSTNLGLYSPTGFGILYVLVRDMSASTNPQFQSTGTSFTGTSASPAMPPQVALVLTGRTNQRGRGASGRAYMPVWATNADAGNGQATAAVGTAMNAFGTSLLSNFTASNLVSCIAKPARQAYTGITGTQHAARGAGTADVSSWTARDLIWDNQRIRVKP